MACKYWNEGHKFMNCRYCRTPNHEYCKKWKDVILCTDLELAYLDVEV